MRSLPLLLALASCAAVAPNGVTRGGVALAWSYDPFGRVAAESRDGRTVSASRDADGRLASFSAPGIAQTFATCGVKTFMVDVKQEFLDRGTASIHKSLAKFAEKGTLTADVAERAKSLLTATTDMGVLSHPG